MPRRRKADSKQQAKDADITNQRPKDAGDELQGAATKTDRVSGKRSADDDFSAAAVKKRRTIAPTSIQSGISKIRAFAKHVGFSEGHNVQVSSLPSSWTAEICADPDHKDCVENLVSARCCSWMLSLCDR